MYKKNNNQQWRLLLHYLFYKLTLSLISAIRKTNAFGKMAQLHCHAITAARNKARRFPLSCNCLNLTHLISNTENLSIWNISKRTESIPLTYIQHFRKSCLLRWAILMKRSIHDRLTMKTGDVSLLVIDRALCLLPDCLMLWYWN